MAFNSYSTQVQFNKYQKEDHRSRVSIFCISFVQQLQNSDLPPIHTRVPNETVQSADQF